MNRLIMQAASQYQGKDRETFVRYIQQEPMAAAQLRAPLYEDKVVDFLFAQGRRSPTARRPAPSSKPISKSEEGHVHGPGCGHDHAMTASQGEEGCPPRARPRLERRTRTKLVAEAPPRARSRKRLGQAQAGQAGEGRARRKAPQAKAEAKPAAKAEEAGQEGPTKSLSEREIVCEDLDLAIDDLQREGFRLDVIYPADDPQAAVLSRGRRDRFALTMAGRAAALPTRLPAFAPEFVLTRDGASPAQGRAGMLYRDLIPGRLGGRYIASHITIPEGGPVADWVHYHRIALQMIYVRRGWVQRRLRGPGRAVRDERGRPGPPAARNPPSRA